MEKNELLKNIEMVCYAIRQKTSDKNHQDDFIYEFNCLNFIYLTNTFSTDNNSNQYNGNLIIDTINLKTFKCDLTFKANKEEMSVVYANIPLEIFNNEIIEEIYLKLKESFFEL